MKAIYIKPEMEVVNLQVEEDIAYGKFAYYSVKEDRASGNSGFFDDDSTIGNKDTFFDD